MRALLILSKAAGWAVRALAVALVFIPYALGWVLGAMVFAATSLAAAARIGWQDGRKGNHGAA